MHNAPALTNSQCILIQNSTRDVRYRQGDFALSQASDTGPQSCTAYERVSKSRNKKNTIFRFPDEASPLIGWQLNVGRTRVGFIT